MFRGILLAYMSLLCTFLVPKETIKGCQVPWNDGQL